MENELLLALTETAMTRTLPQDVILEALQAALVSAYRREKNASASQAVEARIDTKTGRARLFVEKEVVEAVEFPDTEVSLEKARFYNPEAQNGDTVMVQVEGTTKKFDRIAAQNAKQVILQKIREAERDALYKEFVVHEGDIMAATVQNVTPTHVALSLGRAEAKMPRAQQIPGEFYRQHEKIRVYVVEVKRTNKGPEIICSRGHRDMLRRLLEYEVPEIYNSQVEIKSIAREAGFRSKVAVSALQEGIDPVGACVGQRGNRIQNIVNELHNEKIDVIEWRSDARSFITEALRPARVTGVYLDEDIHTGRTAVVIVPDDQLSLAIGREGQNARLAAKLTGWRIDIKSVTETVQSALDNIDLPPLSDLLRTHGALVDDTRRIMEKKLNNRTVMPEEYTILGRFADVVERLLLIEREDTRRAEVAQVEAVRSTLPEELFHVPISVLDLPDDLEDSLSPLGSVGAVMLAMLVDEDRLRKLIGKNSAQQLGVIQSVLDELVDTVTDFSTLIPHDADDRADVQLTIAPVADPRHEAEAHAVLRDEADAESTRDAFGNAAPTRVKPPVEVKAGEAEEEFDEDGDVIALDGTKKDKNARTKRRQLVFDEKTGEVVSKRKRKGNRNRNDWGSDDF